MDTPKCKICDERHYGLCSSDLTEDGCFPASNVATNIPDATNKLATNKTLNRRDRDKYNEYQREYMRRRLHGLREEEGS